MRVFTVYCGTDAITDNYCLSSCSFVSKGGLFLIIFREEKIAEFISSTKLHCYMFGLATEFI